MKRDLKKAYVKPKLVIKDGRGNHDIAYSEEATEIEWVVRDAGGQTLTAIYGERLKDVKVCTYIGDEIEKNVSEGFGICLEVPSNLKPDYKIAYIEPLSTHKLITIEKL